MVDPFNRSLELIVHSRQPFNAEPPLPRLRESFITPQSLLYVRSHGDIPSVDTADYRVSVAGHVLTPLDLSLAELKGRFAPKTVHAAMQCAGNRRADLREVRPVSGDPWAGGAIGHAEWTGVALADVLRAAGCRDGDGLHVAFEALDRVESDDGEAPYGISIPLSKALCPEVILAFAMNGEELTPEHGYPLRVVVPGYAGVRSAKWVSRVTVRDGPSTAFHQAKDYKLFPPGMSQGAIDHDQGFPINEMPLNAVICAPSPGQTVKSGRVLLRGFAIASSRAVRRVEVSSDGGRNWGVALIEDNGGSPWSWSFWRAELDLVAGEHELVVRAWDAAGQTQPARAEDVWNCKGYLSAAWHRLRVTAA